MPWLVVPQEGQAPVESNPQAVHQGVATGQLAPGAAVSIDGGRSWQPAMQAIERHRLQGHNDAAMRLIAPMRVEPSSVIAGYLALFSLFFFGGPFVGIAAVAAWEAKPTVLVKLAFILGAAVLGPLPILIPCRTGLRKLKEDPTLDGKGRVYFALAVAALMGLGLVAGLLGVIVRAVAG
jgi:hypothetical protein